MPYRIEPTDALVVVDPQNDFLPGGPLAVAQGMRIFEPINRIAPHFAHVFASRDWHPSDHAYFAANGGPWPYHCLAKTPGAAFSDQLHLEHIDAIVDKGTDPRTDGYSAFAGTKLEEALRKLGITRIFIAGLATDYCVKMTSIYAAANGFEAIVLTDAIAAVNVEPGDEADALEAMRACGVRFATSHELEWENAA